MSDLELVLRHRLRAVKKGVHVGTSVLQDAQDRTGLSNERLGHRLHVSEKTWRRWKIEGEVPAYHLSQVAEILGLEISNGNIPEARQTDSGRFDLLDERVARLEEGQREALAILRELRQGPSARGRAGRR